ncbi:MAG: hypothetical protein LC808_02015 [Actinobacteria bacterium]|nr:hypothetical protein [Actinomycetota bacterium]
MDLKLRSSEGHARYTAVLDGTEVLLKKAARALPGMPGPVRVGYEDDAKAVAPATTVGWKAVHEREERAVSPADPERTRLLLTYRIDGYRREKKCTRVEETFVFQERSSRFVAHKFLLLQL